MNNKLTSIKKRREFFSNKNKSVTRYSTLPKDMHKWDITTNYKNILFLDRTVYKQKEWELYNLMKFNTIVLDINSFFFII